MAESQCLRSSFRSLLGTVRNTSVGHISVCELFDYYVEGDARPRVTGAVRFQKEAARTFVGARSPAAAAVAAPSKLPLIQLCEHIQYVILRNVDPELIFHMFWDMAVPPIQNRCGQPSPALGPTRFGVRGSGSSRPTLCI